MKAKCKFSYARILNEIKSKKQDAEVDDIWAEMNKGVTPLEAPAKKREIKEEVK